MPDFISVDAGGKLTRIDLDTTADAAPKDAIEVSRDLVMAFSANEQTHHYDAVSGTLLADPVTPLTASQLVAYAATLRYAREISGITVGNAPIATDRESQALITGAWAAAQMNPNITLQFKTAAGFVALAAAQVQTIAAAVVAHVQACFVAEARVDADIASGKVTTTAEVDAAFASVPA